MPSRTALMLRALTERVSKHARHRCSLFCPRSAFGHHRRVSLTVRCILMGNDQGIARSTLRDQTRGDLFRGHPRSAVKPYFSGAWRRPRHVEARNKSEQSPGMDDVISERLFTAGRLLTRGSSGSPGSMPVVNRASGTTATPPRFRVVRCRPVHRCRVVSPAGSAVSSAGGQACALSSRYAVRGPLGRARGLSWD
jgi:hypothetical protein